MTVSDGDRISDREIIAAAILEKFLAPYQYEDDPTDPPSIPVSDLCTKISDYPDSEITDVIDELAAERTGVTYDNGNLSLTDCNRAKNYYSMCSPFG